MLETTTRALATPGAFPTPLLAMILLALLHEPFNISGRFVVAKSPRKGLLLALASVENWCPSEDCGTDRLSSESTSVKSMVSFLSVSEDECTDVMSVASYGIVDTVEVADGFGLLYFGSSHFSLVAFFLLLIWLQDAGEI